MKCKGILSGGEPIKSMTREEFSESRHAASELGRLLVELVEESAWSLEYSVEGVFFDDQSKLRIVHPDFFLDAPILISTDSGIELSVSGVQALVLQHLTRCYLEQKRKFDAYMVGSDSERHRILWYAARAALTARFPAVETAIPLSNQTGSDLFAFSSDIGMPVYVARVVGCEFRGGFACINMAAQEWGNMHDEQYVAFFLEVARDYASSELDLSEDALICSQYFLRGRTEQFEEVIFWVTGKNYFARVYFDQDNLPSRLSIVHQGGPILY